MGKFPDDWPEIAWAKLTVKQRQRAVDILRGAAEWPALEEIVQRHYPEHGRDWVGQPPLTERIPVPYDDDPDAEIVMPWHMGGGMVVRNYLRQHGFTDDQLPGLPELYEVAQSTWDDFYVQAVEAAAGVRPISDVDLPAPEPRAMMNPYPAKVTFLQRLLRRFA